VKMLIMLRLLLFVMVKHLGMPREKSRVIWMLS
jgi:hypothetical protein